MKKLNLLLFWLVSVLQHTVAQNIIEWDSRYALKLSDFKSEASKIGGNVNSLNSAMGIQFSFSMSNYEFMFTKNFNSKVSCTFARDASSLIASDEKMAECLLKFSQFDFDLSELYARKFRKALYENKGAFSSAGFFKPIYDDINKEFTQRHSKAADETQLGQDETKLQVLHAQVLYELNELPDFCKTCKPPKKSKTKKE